MGSISLSSPKNRRQQTSIADFLFFAISFFLITQILISHSHSTLNEREYLKLINIIFWSILIENKRCFGRNCLLQQEFKVSCLRREILSKFEKMSISELVILLMGKEREETHLETLRGMCVGIDASFYMMRW